MNVPTRPTPGLLSELPVRADVVVVGAGHNGLVASVLLSRAGLKVVVLESADVVGGACRTERPFPRVPGLSHSTGAYLLGLMPPELHDLLGLDLPLLRRDPHYFLPTLDGRTLLFGSDAAATEAQFRSFFSAADWAADRAMHAELAALRTDIAPTWLAEPLTVEETAERHVRPALRDAFVRMCRGSVADYLARFGFASELIMAMYAVTDGLSGLTAGPDTPGSGHNFLVHNMCRLPGADGTWMIVRGGMGTVTGRLADAARAAGATIVTGAAASQILVSAGVVTGVAVAGPGGGPAGGPGEPPGPGHVITAPVVLGACDPTRLIDLVGRSALPAALVKRVEGYEGTFGTTMKVNLALCGLPTFPSLPAGSPSPFGATIHLLPDGDGGPLAALRAMWAEVQAGRLPDWPTIEWYVHSTADPTIADADGHHSSALFVQSVPYALADSTWGVERDRYVDRLLSIVDRFAPGTSDLVTDMVAFAPPDVASHFGISRGHIHHVDNAVAFADRMPYSCGLPGLYAGSAGCHPAGSVIGAAGHNAAQRILSDLG